MPKGPKKGGIAIMIGVPKSIPKPAPKGGKK